MIQITETHIIGMEHLTKFMDTVREVTDNPDYIKATIPTYVATRLFLSGHCTIFLPIWLALEHLDGIPDRILKIMNE